MSSKALQYVSNKFSYYQHMDYFVKHKPMKVKKYTKQELVKFAKERGYDVK